MTRTELTNTLSKMFCNYIQESDGDDMETFFNLAIDFVVENSELSMDDDEQSEIIFQIVAVDVMQGRV